MPHKEMMKRLETLQCGDYGVIKEMILKGFGAQGIKNETPFTIKQINAVFEAVEQGF